MLILKEERWYSKLEIMHILGYHLSEVFEGSVIEESYHLDLPDPFKFWKDEEKWHIDWSYLNAWQELTMCFMYHN
jgi:hypothetical protein